MNQTYARTIIVDDEVYSAELLLKLLSPYSVFGSISIFTDALMAFNTVTTHPPEFLFLDIEMPGLNGLQFLERINTQHPAIKVIFVTAWQNYALEALRRNAFDYLLKPIEKHELIRVVDKILGAQSVTSQSERIDPGNFILIRTSEGVYHINVDELLYLEADSSYTSLVLTSGKQILSTNNIGKITETLSKTLFLRISRKNVVNRKYITFIHSKDKYITLESSGYHYKLNTTLKASELKNMLAL
jgi:two-component system, LytTR family, response regulator